jgi:hypothetical protein
MTVKLRTRKTGVIKEVTSTAWEMMKKDGRSRHYTQVLETAPKAEKKEKEEIKIEAIIPEKKYPFGRKPKEEIKEPESQDENQEKQTD